jgi:hypothetical protein
VPLVADMACRQATPSLPVGLFLLLLSSSVLFAFVAVAAIVDDTLWPGPLGGAE